MCDRSAPPPWARSWSIAREWFIERFGPIDNSPDQWQEWKRRFHTHANPKVCMADQSCVVFNDVVARHTNVPEFHRCDSCDWAQWEGPERGAGITSAYVADCNKVVHYIDEQEELEGSFALNGEGCRWYSPICFACSGMAYIEKHAIVDGEHELSLDPCCVCNAGAVRGWEE